MVIDMLKGFASRIDAYSANNMIAEEHQPSEVLQWALALLPALKLYVAPTLAGTDLAIESIENEVRSILQTPNVTSLPNSLAFALLSLYSLAMSYTRFNESSMRLKTAKEILKTKLFGVNAMSTKTMPETQQLKEAIESLYIGLLEVLQQSLQRKVISFRSFIALLRMYTKPLLAASEQKLYLLVRIVGELTLLTPLSCLRL